MFVTPVRRKTLGAAILGTLTLGACADPVASTDLRPEGPPDVLAVLVFNDTVNGAVEAATYCKPNDPKRPGKVGLPAYGINPIICPLDGSAVPELTDAWPDAWYVRVMFDELLDPDVETLQPILDSMGNPTDGFTGSLATTQPVTLQCEDVNGLMVDVDYDGYYSPSGNTVTWPLGPSLVIQPIDPTVVPVESRCELTLKEAVITDKDGEPIAPGDRKPFTFKIAPISVISVAPSEGGTIDPSVGGVAIDFNVEIDGSTKFCTDPAAADCVGDPTRLFSLTPTAMATNTAVDNNGTGLVVHADLLGDQTYTLALPVGFKVKDKCGKESTVVGAPEPFDFSTNPAKFVSFNPGGGSAVAPSKKITIAFNQVIDRATFVEGEDFTIMPKPASFAVQTGTGTSIRLTGDYNLSTTYNLTIKSGASISDKYGKQTITFTKDEVTEFTTASEIAITAQSPANGARIIKATPSSAVSIRLTFNQEMAAGSLDLSEISLTRADGSATGITPTVTVSNTVATISATALPAGSYKFTLNKDATLEDKIVPPNRYTQAAADRVILFTVDESPPADPAPDFKCLGAE